MTAIGLLDAALKFLATLQNLRSVGVVPCMSDQEAKELQKLIDDIWDLLREEKRNANKK